MKKQKEHPEDRIFKDREFLKRITKIENDLFDNLVKDLNLNRKGDEQLFDYVYNCDEEILFEEYLMKYKMKYADLLNK
jgi:hypothetical protein